MLFGDLEAFNAFLCSKFGEDNVKQIYEGGSCGLAISVVYYPDINEFRGNTSLQMIMKYYQ